MAEFWAAVLDGYEVEPSGDAYFARGDGTSLFFHERQKSPTIELPIHLDVNVPDWRAELERLLALGATLVETKTQEVGQFSETWTVMRDPEGNGFCIQSPPQTNARLVGNVTFSCAEPKQLGSFWAGALGWPAEPVDPAFIQQMLDAAMDERETGSLYALRETPTSRPRFLFQRREKSRPASYPIHLDFLTDDREAELVRLQELGATVEETKSSGDTTWTVMRDPESNPFCVE